MICERAQNDIVAGWTGRSYCGSRSTHCLVVREFTVAIPIPWITQD